MPLFCCISGIFYRRIDFSSNTHSCKVFCSWVYWLQKSDLDHPGPLVDHSLTTRLFEWLFFWVIRPRTFEWCTQLRFPTIGSNKNDLRPLKIDLILSLTTSGRQNCSLDGLFWYSIASSTWKLIWDQSRPLKTTNWPLIDHSTTRVVAFLNAQTKAFWTQRASVYG